MNLLASLKYVRVNYVHFDAPEHCVYEALRTRLNYCYCWWKNHAGVRKGSLESVKLTTFNPLIGVDFFHQLFVPWFRFHSIIIIPTNNPTHSPPASCFAKFSETEVRTSRSPGPSRWRWCLKKRWGANVTPTRMLRWEICWILVWRNTIAKPLRRPSIRLDKIVAGLVERNHHSIAFNSLTMNGVLFCHLPPKKTFFLKFSL